MGSIEKQFLHKDDDEKKKGDGVHRQMRELGGVTFDQNRQPVELETPESILMAKQERDRNIEAVPHRPLTPAENRERIAKLQQQEAEEHNRLDKAA